MTDVAVEAPRDVSDEEILARFLNAKNPPPSARTVGLRMIAVSQEEMRVEAAFDARADLFANPTGVIQGGYLCAILDEVMSIACMVASKMTAVAPTLEMKTSFLRPAMPGELRGIGRVTKWGRQIAFTEGELFGADGRLVAKATGTAMPTPFSSYRRS